MQPFTHREKFSKAPWSLVECPTVEERLKWRTIIKRDCAVVSIKTCIFYNRTLLLKLHFPQAFRMLQKPSALLILMHDCNVLHWMNYNFACLFLRRHIVLLHLSFLKVLNDVVHAGIGRWVQKMIGLCDRHFIPKPANEHKILLGITAKRKRDTYTHCLFLFVEISSYILHSLLSR